MLFEIMKGNYSPRELPFVILVMLFALTISFSFHEFMHAAAATWLGDDTPGNMGRLTLNPAAHLDPIGTACLILLGFGWGKPVMFNPNRLTRFKSKRLMMVMVSLAGVFGNFILALISAIILVIYMMKTGIASVTTSPGMSIVSVLAYIHSFSMGLLAFNLLPIPPLDGFRVIEEVIPLKLKYSNGWKKFCMYGPRVLMAIILIGSMTGINVLTNLIYLIEAPFEFIISIISVSIGRLFI